MLNGNFTNTQGRYYLVCNNGTNIINDEGTLAGNFTGDCTGNIVFLDVSADPYPFEYDHINCQIHYTGANAMWPRRKCNGKTLKYPTSLFLFSRFFSFFSYKMSTFTWTNMKFPLITRDTMILCEYWAFPEISVPPPPC